MKRLKMDLLLPRRVLLASKFLLVAVNPIQLKSNGKIMQNRLLIIMEMDTTIHFMNIVSDVINSEKRSDEKSFPVLSKALKLLT